MQEVKKRTATMSLVKLICKEVDKKLTALNCKVEGVNWQSASRWEHFLKTLQVIVQLFLFHLFMCPHNHSCVFLFVQALIGPQYLIDAVAKIREVHERLYHTKPITVDMLKANSEAVSLINEIVECKRKNKGRLELLSAKQSQAVGDENRLRVATRIPITRELIAVGDFDPEIDAVSRRPFLALAPLDVDPMVQAIGKRSAKAQETAGKAGKPRVEHEAKPMSPECFADGDSMWLRCTPKVSSVWVQNNSMCLDVLDPDRRSIALPPNSESFTGVIIDLPYGLQMAEWDILFSRDQVC